MDLGTLGLFALMLICPLAMMLMMRGGGHGGHDTHDHGVANDRMDHMSDEQLHELSGRAERELQERKTRSGSNA